MIFLATSGNNVQFFFNQLMRRQNYDKLTESIKICMKTVVLDKKQFDDEKTLKDFEKSLDTE